MCRVITAIVGKDKGLSDILESRLAMIPVNKLTQNVWFGIIRIIILFKVNAKYMYAKNYFFYKPNHGCNKYIFVLKQASLPN